MFLHILLAITCLPFQVFTVSLNFFCRFLLKLYSILCGFSRYDKLKKLIFVFELEIAKYHSLIKYLLYRLEHFTMYLRQSRV